MSAGESSVSGSGDNHNVVSQDYSDKKADSGEVPKFNGDPEEFSWWKTNFYNYIMGFQVLIEEKELLLRRNQCENRKCRL